MKEVDIKDILYTISTWQLESKNKPKYYLSKIQKVQDTINRIKKPKLIT